MIKFLLKAAILADLISCYSTGLCAQPVLAEAAYVQDPWESYNRWMYMVNTKVDAVTLKPIAKSYRAVVPRPLRQGLSNIVYNGEEPWTLINTVLQGKGDAFFQTLGRLMINTTVGLGGIFDVASKWGVPRTDTNLGDTMAIWGMPSGPYLMLPFLGPSTPLDALGTAANIAIGPTSFALGKLYGIKASWPYTGMRILDLRVDLLGTADKVLEASDDPYVTVRSAYLQRRAYKIKSSQTTPAAKSDDPFESGDASAEPAPKQP